MTVQLRHLRIAAHAELVSLTAMLANLFTAHLPSLSALLGPTHGCAYLFVVAATWRLGGAAPSAKALSLVPGVGGLLALRRLRRTPTAPQPRPGQPAPS
ncbi:MAG: DUF3817 domain-containing protein [Actinomycetia bacterium]|nr:DUF3817 domain-containing protein [Actinomycetes bacterium]